MAVSYTHLDVYKRQEYIVRGVLSTSKTEQLGKAVVKTVNNFPVTLEDIANVTIISHRLPTIGI